MSEPMKDVSKLLSQIRLKELEYQVQSQPYIVVLSLIDHIRELEAALAAEQAENANLREEHANMRARVLLMKLDLDEWRPLTVEEAQAAYDDAEAEPMSEEQIQRILKNAMDPAHRCTNSEQAQMAAAIRAKDEENTHLRAALAVSKDPCTYCQLPKEEMVKCKSGFPGCARMDDMTGCPEFGSMMNEHQLREELRAKDERIAELRAMLEDKGDN